MRDFVNIFASVLVMLLLCSACTLTKRSISRVPPPPPPLTYPENIKLYECLYIDSLNPKERLEIYPFNKASRIEIISYPSVRVYAPDSSYIEPGGIPMLNSKIDFTKIQERIVLPKNLVDTLTNILYNYRSKTQIIEHLTCDCPCTNAILFFNKKDKCFAYLGLCFGGPDFFAYPDEIKVNTGDFCIGKYELLMAFFKKTGIKYGLDPPENNKSL
jgi:hypothetical protein